MLRWRWLGGRAMALATALTLAVMGLAVAGVTGAAPTARASGPGSCAVAVPQSSVAPAGGVSARLSRAQGVPGTALSLSGSRWPAGATVQIDVYQNWNGATYAASYTVVRGTASADGSLTLSQFRAPVIYSCGSAEGGDVLFLVHTLDGRARAPLTFTYLAYLNGPGIITPSVGQALTPGAGIPLKGARWEPNERVTITPMRAPWVSPASGMPEPAWRPITSDAISVTTDNQGAFSVTLPALDEPAETQITFFAEGTGPRYGDVGIYTSQRLMLPKVFPTLHLDQTGVYAGGDVTVSGDHWPANAEGVIEYCRGQTTLPNLAGLRCPNGGQHLGAFQADNSGHFRVMIHLPPSAALGPITVQARIPTAPFGLNVYAQGQPLSVIPTFAQAHPRLTRLIGMAPYLGGALVTLLAVTLAVALTLRRRRGSAQSEA